MKNEKKWGGCAQWWGFHTYTPAKFFKSVFFEQNYWDVSKLYNSHFSVVFNFFQLHIFIL